MESCLLCYTTPIGSEAHHHGLEDRGVWRELCSQECPVRVHSADDFYTYDA